MAIVTQSRSACSSDGYLHLFNRGRFGRLFVQLGPGVCRLNTLRSFAARFLWLVFFLSLIAALARWKTYDAQDRNAVLGPSSLHHPFGTDGLGRDRLTRLALAALLSLGLSSSAALLSTVFAGAVGLMAGSLTRHYRRVILVFCDLLVALPWIFLVMILRGLMPLDTSPMVSTLTTYLLLACFGWPACARVVCGGVLSMQQSWWMTQLRAQGTGNARLLSHHLLPNLRPLLLAQFLIAVPAFLVAEVNLGLIGLGTAEPLPSWGGMLHDLESYNAWTGSRLQLIPLVALILVTGSLQLCLLEEGSA